jgi:hypothetical protein
MAVQRGTAPASEKLTLYIDTLESHVANIKPGNQSEPIARDLTVLAMDVSKASGLTEAQELVEPPQFTKACV